MTQNFSMNQTWKILGTLLAIGTLVLFLNAYGRSEGVTPLMKAAKAGDVTEVAALIADGSDVNAKSKYDWTALMFAAHQGEMAVVTELLNAGADVNSGSKPVTASFETTADYPESNALSESIKGGHDEIAIILIDQGALVEPISMALAGGLANPPLLQRMYEKGGELNGISDVEWYRSPLSYAARQGNLQNIDWLISKGADPNLKLPNSTNLSQAAGRYHLAAAAMLIEKGADVNQQFGSAKRTVLWQTMQGYVPKSEYSENLKLIELFLSNGADPSYLYVNQDKTMSEHTERSIEKLDQESMNPEHDEIIQERYRNSAEYERAVLRLLKAFQQ